MICPLRVNPEVELANADFRYPSATTGHSQNLTKDVIMARTDSKKVQKYLKATDAGPIKFF